MHPASDGFGYIRLQITKGLQGHNFLLSGSYAPIIPHPFNVKELTEQKLFQPVFGLDENEFSVHGESVSGKIGPRPLHSLQKPVESKGLEQVIGYFKFEPPQRIFMMGSSDDHLAFRRQRFQELYP